MNTALLLQVKDAILAETEHFDMGYWFRDHMHRDRALQTLTQCGTTACIAGWAVYIGIDNVRTVRWIEYKAKALLDLSKCQASRLFYVANWPLQYYSAYHDATSDLQRAVVAAQRIEHFIATNGDE